MRILHVITTLDVGGAEMHLLSQVRGQAARGHDVRVVYLKGFGTLADDLRAAGALAVEHIALGSGVRLLGEIRGADLIHTHLLKADMAVAALATTCGRRRRLVSSKHSDEQALRRTLPSRIHGVLGNLPVRTIVLSEHVAAYFRERGRVRPESIRRIYYGIDPTPFETAVAQAPAGRAALRAGFGFGERDVVFICAARFAPAKAHDVLLRAFARAVRETAARSDDPAPLRLLLVGDDPFGDGRVRAEALAAELELGPAVHFAGIRRDVPALLAISDVLVMSSLWEGLGLAFLEAMCAGLPVLATRVSAIPEVVVDGETGVLVPPADDAALAAGVLRLANDPPLRQRLGAAGRKRIPERFGLERMIDETLAVYAEVVGSPAVEPRT